MKMNALQKNFIILIVSLLIGNLFFEIYLRIYPKIILDNISLMSSTNLKYKMIFKSTNKKLVHSNEQIVMFDDVNLKINMNTYYIKASKEDKFFGAVDFMIKNNGFCNNHTNFDYSKILTIGDSFTQCTQILPEDTWSYKLFNFEDKKKISNLGMQSTGPAFYNKVLKKYLKKNQIIYYAFYEGNDWLKLKILDNKNQKIFSPKNFFFKSVNKTLGNFYTFNFLVIIKRINDIKNFNKNNVNFQYLKKKPIHKYNIFNTNNSDLNEIEIAKSFTQNSKLYKNELTKIFLEAKKMTEENNSKIIFLYIPSAYSAFGEINTEFVDPKLKDIMFSFTKQSQNIFDNICIKNKLECFNTVKDLIKFNLKSEIPSHFNTNVHLTPAGSTFIAKQIRSYTCNNIDIKKTIKIKNLKNLCKF